MPAKPTICGLPLSLLVTASVALQLPDTVGANAKVSVVTLPGLTVMGVPGVTANAAALGPTIARFEITKPAVPELVTVTVLVVVLAWLPKLILDELRLRTGVDVEVVCDCVVPPPPPLHATKPYISEIVTNVTSVQLNRLFIAAPQALKNSCLRVRPTTS
jgi:hypothetical protein